MAEKCVNGAQCANTNDLAQKYLYAQSFFGETFSIHKTKGGHGIGSHVPGLMILLYHIFFFHNTLALTCILSSTLKAACKCIGFVHCTSSQHIQCLLRCC